MAELMDKAPTPKVGRPLKVDVTEMKALAEANPGRWVADTFTENEAASARRQFKKLGWKVATATAAQPGFRKVMVKSA